MDNTYVYLPARFAETINSEEQIKELNAENNSLMIFEGKDATRGGFLKIKFAKN